MITCEHLFWEVLPAVRRYLALRLRSEGYSLKEIAEVLGVSVPAVSQYLHGKRGRNIPEEVKVAVEEALREGCIDLLDIVVRVAKKEGGVSSCG